MTNSGRTAVAVGLFILLVVGAGLVFLWNPTLGSANDILTWLEARGHWAPMFVILLMIVHSLVPFPAELLALCAGAIFGAVWGAVLIWSGAMLGAILAFWLARAFGQEVVNRTLSKSHRDTLANWSAQQGTTALLISRFIPLIAFNLINYAAGLSRVRFTTFLWTTAVGILPVTVLTTYLGQEMKTLSWTALGIVSGVGISVIWIANKIFKVRMNGKV